MTNFRLWFGPIAVALFLTGTIAIGLFTPDYSHIRQTVSELGEAGTPGQVAFSVLLCLIAACLIVCAGAIARTLHGLGHSALPAYFVIGMAISCAGVGIFSFPHPLHNVFGLSETVGLQAPLVAALVGRRDDRTRQARVFSTAMYLLVLLAIAINLIPLFRPANLWADIRPYFGLVQRSLFISWFTWCAGYALFLMPFSRTSHATMKTLAAPNSP